MISQSPKLCFAAAAEHPLGTKYVFEARNDRGNSSHGAVFVVGESGRVTVMEFYSLSFGLAHWNNRRGLFEAQFWAENWDRGETGRHFGLQAMRGFVGRSHGLRIVRDVMAHLADEELRRFIATVVSGGDAAAFDFRRFAVR